MEYVRDVLVIDYLVVFLCRFYISLFYNCQKGVFGLRTSQNFNNFAETAASFPVSYATRDSYCLYNGRHTR
jgi:IS1 family transposase